MRNARVTPALAVIASACSLAAACRRVSPVDPLPPLGPGTEHRFTVNGGRPLDVSVASALPYVAMAWVVDRPGGREVLIATSADNGRTFRAPAAASDGATTPALARASVEVATATAGGGDAPRFAMRWVTADREVARDVTVRRDGSPDLHAIGRVAAVAPAVRCDPSGAVVWAAPAVGAGDDGPSGPVDVNHRLPDQACVDGEVSAAVDPRGWVHVAWIGGAATATVRQVFYASSSDGRWFGRAQVLDQEASASPSHVQLAIDPNETVVTTWTTGEAPATRVVMRQLIPAHHGPAQLLPLTTLAAEGVVGRPTIAAVRGGVIVAWLRTASDAPAIAFRRVGLDAVCDPANAPVVSGSSADPFATPSVGLGEELYATNGCATCHGVTGHGDGPVGLTLSPRPRDFRDVASFKAGRDEAAIALTVAQGFNERGSKMPAFSHLSEQERRSLALFVMSLRDQIPERKAP